LAIVLKLVDRSTASDRNPMALISAPILYVVFYVDHNRHEKSFPQITDSERVAVIPTTKKLRGTDGRPIVFGIMAVITEHGHDIGDGCAWDEDRTRPIVD